MKLELYRNKKELVQLMTETSQKLVRNKTDMILLMTKYSKTQERTTPTDDQK